MKKSPTVGLDPLLTPKILMTATSGASAPQAARRLRLPQFAFGFVSILTTLFLTEALGVLGVYASLLVPISLIEHAPLLEAKGGDDLGLGRICWDFASGTVVDGAFRLASRAGFLWGAVGRSFGAGCGVALVSLPSARCLASFPLGLGVDPFADAVEFDRPLGWRRVEARLIRGPSM